MAMAQQHMSRVPLRSGKKTLALPGVIEKLRFKFDYIGYYCHF